MQPLAVSVVGGLLFATALTLVVIPCLYVLLHGRFGAAAITAPALVTLLAAANAFGATLHVAMSGDDAAAGTPAAPWRTIQPADTHPDRPRTSR
jgi:hypothetical protein